jgi:hypothetical protein
MKKMSKTDYLWVAVFLVITSLFAIPATRGFLEAATAWSPYLMGFVKTATLATMGELLACRIRTGSYNGVRGIGWRMAVWGFLGMLFVLAFKLFSGGVAAAQTAGLLPFFGSNGFFPRLWTAFLTSVLMNLFFAPAFMILHRITDGVIDAGQGKWSLMRRVRIREVASRIDFPHFVGFVLGRTIPLFWIPAHTVTFMLPDAYRVLMAAYLSIALGIILSLSKTQKTPKTRILPS